MRLRARAFFCGFTPKDDHEPWARPDSYKERLDDNNKLLAISMVYNEKNPEEAALSHEPLGCPGSYGAVLKTKTGVVKFDRSFTEAMLYACLPSYIKKHPILPKNVTTGSVRLPLSWGRTDGQKRGRVKLSTICREDLNSLSYNANVSDKLSEIYGELHAQIRDYQVKSGNSIRDRIKEKLVGWHKKCQASSLLSSDEKKRLKRFAGGIARLVRFGIVPGDLHQGNYGLRADGSIVIRDAGIYYVLNDKIKPTVPPPEIKKPKVILKSLEKLRALRTPKPLQYVRSYILRHNAR